MLHIQSTHKFKSDIKFQSCVVTCSPHIITQDQLQHSSLTLGLASILLSWVISPAMEMKQTSLNVGTMDLELATVNPLELLGFSAVLVSQCSKLSCDTALHEHTVHVLSVNIMVFTCNWSWHSQYSSVNIVPTLFLHLGRVKRCTVDVETAPLNASQTRASIQQ